MKNKLILATLTSALIGSLAWSQPTPIPPGTNALCNAGPGTDTVVSVPDSEGFYSLFDGVSTKGWWESCKSTHSGSGSSKDGGTWLVDPTNKAIYSAQNADGNGSIFMTNKKFGNYELVLDLWPDFNNDGGIFNRTTEDGKCYQTTIDYISGSSVGGSYGEGVKENGSGWNSDPYTFGSSETIVSDAAPSWKAFTATKTPASFGCSSGGCVPADWTKIWDVNGWNQLRIKFYGGLTSATPTRMETFLRDLKTPNKPWVPMMDETRQIVQPANFIGLQIHKGGSRWKGAAGSWYRNIKWRELTDKGDVLNPPVPSGFAPKSLQPAYRIATNSSALTGVSEADFTITVRDTNGKTLEHFSGRAGEFSHPFSKSIQGVLLVEFKTNIQTDHLRLNRVF
jgi:hypothetical protein